MRLVHPGMLGLSSSYSSGTTAATRRDRRLRQRAEGEGDGHPANDRVDAADHAGGGQQQLQRAGGHHPDAFQLGHAHGVGGGKNGTAAGSRLWKYWRMRKIPTAWNKSSIEGWTSP